jgi:hypothetical protein
VVFNLSSLNLPANYSVRIYVNGQGWTYSESPSFVFYPAAPGSYDGMIKVNNHPVATDDLVSSPISKLQVYPNPFNPSTTIAFSSSKAQETKVELYNLKGQRVRTLYSGFLPTGSHKLVWDGKDSHGRGVGSGIYFRTGEGKNYQPDNQDGSDEIGTNRGYTFVEENCGNRNQWRSRFRYGCLLAFTTRISGSGDYYVHLG